MFCNQTVSVLKTHPLLNETDTAETVHLIEKVLKSLKIVNVKRNILGV